MSRRFARIVIPALVLGLGLFVISCGDDEEEEEQSNNPPTANAGDDLSVGWQLDGTNQVTLDGSASRDGDGSIVLYEWTRVDTDGTDVTLTDADAEEASFSARPLAADEVLTFQLTVTDNDGATDTDEVSITITAADLAAGECVALGGHGWNNWTKTAAGGSGSLPTPETNSDYARCKACHGWDQLGTDGGYVRRSRKDTRPNAGAGDTVLTVSRNVSSGGFAAGDILMAGMGRGWDEGTLSWNGGTPAGFAEGNEHPDFSEGDNLPTDVQIDCLVAFLNAPGARANQVFANIDPSSDPVAYTLIAGASASAGGTFYNTNCLACHGTPDDTTGGPVAGGPEGGLKAFVEGDGKPSEFAHKVRWGETGSVMTRAAMGNPTAGDVADLLAYLESFEPPDLCDPDPCQGISDAVAGSCADVGGGDFTCDCDAGFDWDDTTNTCEEDPAIVSGRADYDNRCASCHAAGAHDTDGFAGDLAGQGSNLVPNLGDINGAMGSLTMTQQEIDDMAAFLDSL
jgi:mono/diheme cytochrome c family protein